MAMKKKAALLGPLNPFRKKVKNEDGSVSTYARFSGKKIKDKSADGKKIKYRSDGSVKKIKDKDLKVKFDKKGNERKRKQVRRDDDGKRTGVEKIKSKDGQLKKYKKTSGFFKRSEKIKMKKDKSGANVVRKAKNTKPGYDKATGQMDGSTERAAGYKYKVKKKGDGIQIKEKGVQVPGVGGGTKKGTKKTRMDKEGNVTSTKTRAGGIHKSRKTDMTDKGEKRSIIGDYSNVAIPTSTTKPTTTPTTTSTTTPTTTDTSTTTTKTTKPNYDDLSFSEAYKKGRAAAKESGVKDFYGDKKGHFTYKGKQYNVETREEKAKRMKNVKSKMGGQRRLGGAITGSIGNGGSQGPHGIL